MSRLKGEKSKRIKSHLKLGKETFGDVPIKECFHKAFDQYFTKDESKESYLKKLG